jgi:hypothetical protein
VNHIPFAKAVLAVILLCLCITESHAQTVQPSDIEAFQLADLVGTREAYQGYLDAFPNGVFSVIARERVRPPLLTDLVPRLAAPEQKKKKIDQADAKRAWQEAWDRVAASDTEAGYLEYLSITEPLGVDRPNAGVALTRYLELTERNVGTVPSGMSCDVPDRDVSKKVLFAVERAYPQSAIAEGIDGIVIGHHVISPSGKSLGFVIKFATHKSFIDSVGIEAMRMTFSPARKNCVTIASRYALTVAFSTTFVHGQHGPLPSIGQIGSIMLPPDAGLFEIKVPVDRAIFIDLPAVPADRDRVWQLLGSADPSVRVDVFKSNGQKQDIVTGSYFLGQSGCPGFLLRLYIPPKQGASKTKSDRAPTFKTVQLKLSTAYDGPNLRTSNSAPISCN